MSTDHTQRPVISRAPAAASPEAGVHTRAGSVHLKWAEDKQQAQARELYIGMSTGAQLGGRRSCGAGDDSPVSVIHANFNMQLSHPSSACTSMEHPLSPGPPPAAAAPGQLQHPAPSSTTASLHLLQRRRSSPHQIISHLQDAADSDYAGLLSERVQQAFSSKSHELLTFKRITELNHDTSGVEAKPPWPNYKSYKKELEWLNLQKDPSSMSNGVSKTVCVQSQKFGGSPDHVEEDIDDGQASEDGFSIYTSNSTSRDQDEDSVIDFFPTANRTSSAAQFRRRSYDRSMNEVGRIVNGRIYHENLCKRVSSLSCNRRQGTMPHSSRSCGGHDDGAAGKYNEVEDDAGCCTLRGRLSSSKWDDAARWLTSPAAPACSRGRSGHGNDHLHLLLPKAARHIQLVQAPAPPADSKSSDPPAAQDKHVPENMSSGKINAGSHAAAGTMRETGTEVQLEKKRDMGTQSTPAEWSRCDSPNAEEGFNYSTFAERGLAANCGTGADQKGTGSQKSSPPRHNTPARRSVSCSKQSGSWKQGRGCAPANVSGKLNLLELENCHLDKLKLARDLPLGTSSTWQLFPEEDTEGTQICEKLMECKTSMSGNGSFHQHHAKVNMLEARVSAWEDVERAKHIAKFKREEAKIEAWESLQRAEADAELRKLEVKLEKMRFEGREKIMGKLGAAQRRAQEMRGAAEAQKVEQLTRVGTRANHIRKSGHLPSSTFNVVCNLTTKIKPTSNLSFP